MSRWADAFGIAHRDGCTHPERISRDGTGWRCNGCGSHTPRTEPTTPKETKK